MASMGYAVPGSVIAVGILIPISWFDRSVDAWLQSTLGLSTGLLLSGSVASLIMAYLVRFLAVSLSTVETGLGKIQPTYDDASRSLGQGTLGTLTNIHVPIMEGSLFTAVMLVFVDVMKELPATIVMQPSNFETLAMRVYQYAEDERLLEAAAPALAIIVVGLVPVMILSWQIARSRQRTTP
jgi:iron(III) transport system permease protein